MIKCIREGTAEWTDNVKIMFNSISGSIAPIILKDVLYVLFTLVYGVVAIVVSLSPVVITAHFLNEFTTSLWVGLPILIVSFVPALLISLWFVVVWLKCKENRG